MCGIAGIFEYASNTIPVNRQELLTIRDHMTSRGPDGCGLWVSDDGRVGLAHRRLSIIDLSDAGAQPMHDLSTGNVITFNGEIYNYRELRRSLEQKGYRFLSESDTEVLLHLYADKGPEMLQELRGMFAFALWDKKAERLFIARDPFGIKPLYISDNGKTLRFASQIKALLAGGQTDTSPDPAGHTGFFLWGHLPEPYTLFKGIRALPAGSYALYQLSSNGIKGSTTKQYCSIPEEIFIASQQPITLSGKELHEYLREALTDSVRHHLLADVPVGVFLSSGLDSATLTALSSEITTNPLKTVTLGFREYQGTVNDEVPHAETISRLYGTEHSTVRVSRDDFRTELSQILDSMDQPSIDGINSYFVSMAAAKSGLKVVLSGLGGDEIFGSYPSFRQIPGLVDRIRPFAAIPGLRRGFRMMTAPLLKHFTSPKYAGVLEYGSSFSGAYLLRRGMYMPWELPELLDGDMVREGWNELQPLLRLEESMTGIKTAHHKISSLEICWYMRNQLLRDSDWASMAHSLELRVPFVDLGLLRKIAPLFGGSATITKKEMASTPVVPLPADVLSRPKTGFTVPTRSWTQESGSDKDSSLRGWAKLLHANQKPAIPAQDYTRYNKPTIIIFRVGQLGDTLVSMPALQMIRRRFPLHRLVLLTDRHAARSGFVSSWDVLQPTGWFDEVIFYEPSKSVAGCAHNFINLYTGLRPLNPDHIFDLSPQRSSQQAMRDSLFFRRIVGTGNYHQFGAMNKPDRLPDGSLPRMVPEWQRLLTIAERFLPDRLNSPQPEFQLPIPENFKTEARAILSSCGLDESSKVVAIGPGSKMPAKCWAIENYVAIGKMLLQHYSEIQLLVFGGKEDIIIGNKLCSEWGDRAHNLAGRLSIYGSAAILKQSICYVGNDTGTMHLAGVVGTPCVAIFSARDYPGLWEPIGIGHKILRADCNCAGCMLEVCNNNKRCLEQLSVGRVYEAIEEVFNR